MSSGRPAAVDVAMTAVPLETGWRRDKWLVADGAARGDGSRRIYVIHTRPPRPAALVFRGVRSTAPLPQTSVRAV